MASLFKLPLLNKKLGSNALKAYKEQDYDKMMKWVTMMTVDQFKNQRVDDMTLLH